MVWQIVCGVFLLVMAGLVFYAVRTTAAMIRNPVALMIAMKLGPKRTRPILLGLAGFMALLGLASLLMALTNSSG